MASIYVESREGLMNKTAYFDNAATTFPKPESVYSDMNKFYRESGVNVARGQYKLADRANIIVAETRELLLKLFHCPQKQVVFSHSATESLNIILQGLDWSNETNVYISPFEHNAVTRVLKHISNTYRINIVELKVDRKSLEFDLEGIKYQFQNANPRAVVVCHASNVCGVIAPIKEIFDFAKTYDATTVVDMAQTAGLIETDLTSVKADFAVFAGHKTLYGPFGIAGFISDKNVNLKPLLYGGTGIDSANQEMPSTIPERYEVGSLNIMAISGLNASLKWINETGIDRIKECEQENQRKLLAILSEYRNINIVGNCFENKIGVVSCVFDGYSCDNIGQVLSEHDIAVRTGLHCSPTAHKFLGTFPSGTVRFSVCYFTKEEDFEMLKQAIEFIKING